MRLSPANPDASAVPMAPAYPPARLPAAPALSLDAFRRGDGPPVPSILDAGQARFVTSGRVAIALALRGMGVGPGDTVLVPAYHCASMIEPVVWAGAAPLFYRIQADTAVDLDDIAAKLAGAGNVRVLMATNYFGFHQPLPALRAFCDAHGIRLLEDCAHSFLGEHAGRPLGSFGDYAIASTMKFYPVYEGGCLVSARHRLDGVRLQPAGIGFEVKMLLNPIENGFAYGRLPLLRRLLALPMAAQHAAWRFIKARRHGTVPALAPGSSEGGFGFDPAWLTKRSSFFSRLMLRAVSRRRMGALRRRHYLRLHEALGTLPGCRPLFASLPDGVYPWVFPLRCAAPEALFHRLKETGVPVIRFSEFLWPGVDAGVCANSVDLSRRVLQLPCHQDLRDEEIGWMIDTVRAAVLAPGEHAR
ncbi:DegT/DnrJ/EryC1/StrS aminotransferase family protein [Pseudoduganella lurida]|uniref:DegT/DnrJ/EryC1/StrS aminotransferase family protein n=1 Tax=Pseudoduganella lurida TaxID=1036180 RepID=A0A562R355_9BURK|nr:aminotransferase class I/II-fold pyridoxal phosphate-dependent enzyme [Pseudoduganella lurida]TWI62984.1 DegT/DnrJ/EryC1/StrS aminotransferase family protein [Pseudoduganella lurida]